MSITSPQKTLFFKFRLNISFISVMLNSFYKIKRKRSFYYEEKNRITFLAGRYAFIVNRLRGQKPDLKEVEKAIANGTLTIEDALNKGLVTQDWVDEFLDANSHAAADKTVSFAIEDFETTTISGETYRKNNIADTTFWAFVDLDTEEAEEWLNTLNSSYPEMQKKGAEVLVCVKDPTKDQTFENISFPMIIYNKSVENALDQMNMSEMVEEIPNCGNWFVNGYFASSWNSLITEEQLLEEVDIFTNLNNEEATEATNQKTESAATAIG